MNSSYSLFQATKYLFASFERRRRIQLAMLLVLQLVGAVAEALSLGAIVPFLTILADPGRATQSKFIARLINGLELDPAGDIQWQLTVIFGVAVILSGTLRLLLVYITARIDFGIGHELGVKLYRNALYQPYEVHVTRNSSEVISEILKVDSIVHVVFHLLNICSAAMMAVFIIAMLVYINPQVAMAALLAFSCIYILISFLTRKRLGVDSRVINQAHEVRVQIMQEGLGSIRDVLLDHAQPLLVERFSRADWPMRYAQSTVAIVGPSPRFIVEALGMVLIALLGYYFTLSSQGIVTAIPILGAFVLGAQRLMPLLQQIYQGWVYIAGHGDELRDVVTTLRQPSPEKVGTQQFVLPFQKELVFEEVSFFYQKSLPQVLSNLSLAIAKGARVGFVGVTGSGKSTVMDLLMGLLQPSTGRILVDGIPLTGQDRLAWQRNVAHVPQAIFLSDASFAENIAFSLPRDQIDMERVKFAASQAQIAEFIESSPDGYWGVVGERGVRLSGGQRQRIGIARALYKRATILVLDEATSALDNETEAAVMQSVESLGRDLTIIIIAHRLTTLQNCDVIYRLDKGHIVSMGSYSDLFISADAVVTAKKDPNA